MIVRSLLSILVVALIAVSGSSFKVQEAKPLNDTLIFEGEKHFKNIRQLTFGGDNAEAYWSYDGTHVT
ncbi:MAG: hypothetical protein ACK5RQ_04135, partial [Bacteroidota bacterium]